MKNLYCFDFDGTLTKEDTMFSFLKFYDSKKFYVNFIKHLPLFFMLKIKLAKADEVKQSFIASILKGEKEENIRQKAQEFFDKNYPNILREKALNFIQKIDKNQSECYLVTASLDIWVKPFSDKLGFKLLSTKAEFEHGIYTGKFASKNCNGTEKVNRITHEIKEKSFEKTIAFGDTQGDKEMLSWADEGFYKFFH